MKTKNIAATVLGTIALFLVIIMARIINTTPTVLSPAAQAKYAQQELDTCRAAKHETKDCAARKFVDEVQHSNQ